MPFSASTGIAAFVVNSAPVSARCSRFSYTIDGAVAQGADARGYSARYDTNWANSAK